MSDLPPAERPTPPRARRAARPKSRSAARRANRPAPGSEAGSNDALPAQAEEAAPETTLEATPKAAASQAEPEAARAAGDRLTIKLGNWTILSRPILLWGGIAGIANFLFSILVILIFSKFGSTKADATNNAGLLEGVYCLSYLVPPALAFYAGLRATTRIGGKSNGAMAGLWGIVFLELVGLIYAVIASAVTNQLQALDGTYWANFGINLLFEGLIAFGAGYLGGMFSDRQRRRAQQQEALTSSS